MRKGNYEKRIEEIQERYVLALGDLAEQIRVEVVEPVCKKHDLLFRAGNGTFIFFHRDEDLWGRETYQIEEDLESMHASFRKDLIPVMQLLRTETTYNDCIGFHVGDVG